MLDKISDLIKEVSSLSVNNGEELESFRLKYLSKKGVISDLFDDFKNVAPENKKEVGQNLNMLKQQALEKYNSIKSALSAIDENSLNTDLSRPAFPFLSGSRHPISIIRNEIIEIFMRIGFTVSEGPEIEDDDHVFTRL